MPLELILDVYISFNEGSENGLKWWIDHIWKQICHIVHPSLAKFVFSDASDTIWGYHSDGICASGKWTSDKQTCHINYMELLALKSVCADVNNTHIRMFMSP